MSLQREEIPATSVVDGAAGGAHTGYSRSVQVAADARAANVAVCIPTFRRPDGLRRLLASLDALTFSRTAAPGITVFIIDNDADRPLSEAHPDFRTWTRLPVDYRVEPKRGLAHVRNAALAAVDGRFDAIAFIDDDEWAEPQWLDALLAMRARTGAMIIQGPVRPAFSAAPAPWMTGVGFYEVGPFEDGAVLTWGASGNCLIDKRMLDAIGVRFDDSFNQSGGEDTDLFDRLLRNGQHIVAARDAIAYETVPAERMSLRWAVRRSYRLGHTLGRVSLSQPGWVPMLARLAKCCARIGLAGAQLLMGLASRTTAARGVINLAHAVGTLSAFARRDVKVYAGG